VRTHSVRQDEIQHQWYLVDASGKTLGRLASRIAAILTGKNKVEFTPSIDMGDGVIVVNAEKIVLTGNKMIQKLYHRHSQYPGGLTSVRAKDLMKKDPSAILENAVKGMLPHNKLRTPRFNRLKVYVGETHPHQAQNPAVLEIERVR
jgi:large subunit ribosomal protein L13